MIVNTNKLQFKKFTFEYSFTLLNSEFYMLIKQNTKF